MTKDAYWFPHDANAHGDHKIKRLLRLADWAGYGVYWVIVELLREENEAGYMLPMDSIDDLCFSMRIERKIIDAIFESKLLINDGEMFWSQSLIDRMATWDEKRKRRIEAGRKGGQAKAKAKPKRRSSNAKAKAQQCSSKKRTEQNRTEEKRTEENSTGDHEDSGTGVPVDSGSALVAPKRKLPVKKKTTQKTDGSRVWNAYSQGYLEKTGVDPVRNKTTNSLCKRIVERLGSEDGPRVAYWFNWHSNAYYVSCGHSLASLLKDCEKLRTEWVTGNQMTQSSAREQDKIGKDGQEWMQIVDEQERKQNGTGNN